MISGCYTNNSLQRHFTVRIVVTFRGREGRRRGGGERNLTDWTGRKTQQTALTYWNKLLAFRQTFVPAASGQSATWVRVCWVGSHSLPGKLISILEYKIVDCADPSWPRGLWRGSVAALLLGIVCSSPTGGHGYLYVVCCQVEVSETGWSLVQRSRTDCDASLCVI